MAVFLFSILSHPLHVSFSNIEYIDSIGRWELSVKLFKDDFGAELNRIYSMDPIIDDDLSQNEVDAYHDYLSDHFTLIFNNDTIMPESWQWKGQKLNYEAVWLSYHFDFTQIPKNITIRNTLMFDLFLDQKNLLIFTYEGKQKAFQFRKNKAEIEFEVD